VWLGLQRLQRNQAPDFAKSKDTPVAKPAAVDQSAAKPDQNALVAPSNNSAPQPIEEPRRHEINQAQLVATTNRPGHVRAKNQPLTAARRQEVEAAKDQLMLAFRMVSAKLNFAQKKAQELNQKEPVHNQHKIG
jgi:hypothetical protein